MVTKTLRDLLAVFLCFCMICSVCGVGFADPGEALPPDAGGDALEPPVAPTPEPTVEPTPEPEVFRDGKPPIT